jgi:hypothetical protein
MRVTSQLITLEMTFTIKCPNPKCRHHKAAFCVVAPSPIAKKGGNARWSKMTPKQRKEHIENMTKARLKPKSKKK